MNLSGLILILKSERDERICVDDSIYEIRASLDHTLIDQFSERFLLAHITKVEEELVPETRVDKVTCSMLSSTDIEVHITPVLVRFASYQHLRVMRIHITEIVGAAASKSRHGAQLDRIALICPVCSTSKRRFS